MTFGRMAWLALLVLPLLLFLVHLLSRQDRRRVVSSLKPWDGVGSEGPVPRRLRLRRPDAWLAVGLLILTCLSLSAADPWIVERQAPSALAVVVDCSPSMGVRDPGATSRRIDLARAAALTALQEAAATPNRLLLLGGRPVTAIRAGSGEATPFDQALSGVVPSSIDVPLDELAIAATGWVSERGGGRVLLISDFAAAIFSTPDLSGNRVVLETIGVGEAAPNVAVVSVATTRGPAGEIAVAANVANAGPDSERVALTARIAGKDVRHEFLDLGPDASAMWSFRLEAAPAGPVEVSVRPGGVLSVDDTLRETLPLRLKFQDDRDLPVELSAALEMPPGTGVIEGFRDRLPAELPSRWMFLPPPRADQESVAGTPVVIDVVDDRGGFLDRHQPILVQPAGLSGLDPPPGAIPVAFAAGRPAVALVDGPRSRGVWSGVAWEATSLAASGELPLLLSDMLRWLAVDSREQGAPTPNLSPHPPLGTRKPSVAPSGVPLSLRLTFLLVAAALVVVEGARRLAGERSLLPLVPLGLVLVLVFVGSTGPRWGTTTRGVFAVVRDVSGPASEAATNTVRSALDRLPAATPATTLSVTDLAKGIDRATLWAVASGGGSMLVVTDGRDPGRRVRLATERAARAGVDVHVLPIASPGSEASIEALHVPMEVRAGEIFEAVAVVRSNVDQNATVILERDGASLVGSAGSLRAGAAHGFHFLLRAPRVSGEIVARVEGAADTEPSDNLARAYLAVRERPRLAVIGYRGPVAGEVEAWDRLPPHPLLDRYDAVLLRVGGSFVPSPAEEEALAVFVAAGRGLLVTCADPEIASALRGGPLAALLPVRLQPPDRPATDAAVVILIDRSGSMEQSTSGGSAFTLAADATQALTELLGDRDRFGLIAFDVAPHVIRPLGSRASGVGLAPGAAGIVPRGGTDWGPALDLALEWLERDRADYRHVILIGDGRLGPGATGEPTRPWPDGVTLSTVSVGGDADRSLLEKLAARRGGRQEHVSRPEDLPRALRREVARTRLPEVRSGRQATVIEAPFAALFPEVGVRPDARVLVVDARPRTEIAVRTERGDPLLAFGRAGWGLVGFLATDPDALERVPAERIGPEGLLGTALFRVAKGPQSSAPRVLFDGCVATVEVLLDEGVRTLPEARVRTPDGETLRPSWTSSAAGRVQATFVARTFGEYLIEVDGARTRLFQATPPQLGRMNPDAEWASSLARAGNGRVVSVSESGTISLPTARPRRVTHDLASALIALAAFVFFWDAVSRELAARGLYRSTSTSHNPVQSREARR